MNIVIVVGLLSVLFAFLEWKINFRHGLKVAFIIIFVFLSIRYEYGNDYKSYLQGFNEIKNLTYTNILDNTNYFEPGWIILNLLFKPFGFFTMVIVLSFLNCLLYYRVIRNYVKPEHYWLAVFLYVFSTGIMLTQLSAMRQSLAISIFLFSIDYVNKKKIMIYIFCVFLAYLIHTSALILLPIYFFNSLSKKWNTILIFLFFVFLFVIQNQLKQYLYLLVSNNFERYEIYYDADNNLKIGFGVFYSFVLFILLLKSQNKVEQNQTIFYKLTILNFLFIPISFINPSLGRISMYFLPSIIVIYPLLFLNKKDKLLSFTLLVSLVIYIFFVFIVFFQSEIYKKDYTDYKTIFSLIGWM